MRSDKRILRSSINRINRDKNITEKEKKKRIKVVENILKEKNIEKRYSKLYDMICDYLDNEFINKNVCGFQNDLCSKRRYMIEKGIKKDSYINGCCHSYKHSNDCEHLKMVDALLKILLVKLSHVHIFVSREKIIVLIKYTLLDISSILDKNFICKTHILLIKMSS